MTKKPMSGWFLNDRDADLGLRPETATGVIVPIFRFLKEGMIGNEMSSVREYG